MAVVGGVAVKMTPATSLVATAATVPAAVGLHVCAPAIKPKPVVISSTPMVTVVPGASPFLIVTVVDSSVQDPAAAVDVPVVPVNAIFPALAGVPVGANPKADVTLFAS